VPRGRNHVGVTSSNDHVFILRSEPSRAAHPLPAGRGCGRCLHRAAPDIQSPSRYSGSDRCCRKSRKLSRFQNLAKDAFQLPPLLQAPVRRVRSLAVAFPWFDVVPHIGTRGTRQRRRKIQFTCKKTLFRQHRPGGEVRPGRELQAAAVHPAASYSITSSARPSSVRGNVRPSALAVFMLMTSSPFVTCCTGRSPGFSPLIMRPA
jgi:hypothetical protein